MERVMLREILNIIVPFCQEYVSQYCDKLGKGKVGYWIIGIRSTRTENCLPKGHLNQLL